MAGGKIRYKNLFEFAYEITAGTVEGKEQRFFQIKVIFNGGEEEIDDYSDLLKSIRGLCYRAGGQQETLRDDVSFYYACKSYLLIHKVENVMRKLISYFMITTVGREWVVEASPRSVIEALDKSKRKQYVDPFIRYRIVQRSRRPISSSGPRLLVTPRVRVRIIVELDRCHRPKHGQSDTALLDMPFVLQSAYV